MAEGILTNSHQPDQPVPREPRSPRHAARVQVQNRRCEYLKRHPSYYANIEHEFADPILYERLIKRFHTASEREAEGRARGYGHTLEADLLRGEAKLTNLENSNGVDPMNGSNGDAAADLEPSWELPVSTKEEGIERWHAFLGERFIMGQDEDFDYGTVDTDEDLDTLVRREAEDAWFDQEEPSWAADNEATEAQPRIGETGIQDF